jgi:hypothetical protein
MDLRRILTLAAIAVASPACSTSSSSSTAAATDLAEVVSVADTVAGAAFVSPHTSKRSPPKKGRVDPMCQSGSASFDVVPPAYTFDFSECEEVGVTVNGSITITTKGWVGDTETLTFTGGPLTVSDAEGTNTLAFDGPVTVTLVISGGEVTVTTMGTFTFDGTKYTLSGIVVTVPLPTPESDAGSGSDTGSGAFTYAGKTIWSGQDNPGVLAVDDANLYWQNESSAGAGSYSIMRAPKPGGDSTITTTEPSKPVTLATLPTDEQAVQILANGTNVYWTQLTGGGPEATTGELVSVPIAGGKTTTLVAEDDDDDLYGQFALDDSYVYYWIETDSFELDRMPLAGGSAEPVASVAFPTGTFSPPIFGGLAIDDTNVYWTQYNFPNDDEVVAKVPKAGGSIVTLHSAPRNGAQIYGCVADGSNVYWLSQAPGQGFITVYSVPIAGGSISAVGKPALSNLPGDTSVLPTGLALLKGDLYYSNLQAIVGIPVGGGALKQVALTPLQGQPVFFVSDSANIYWTLQGESETDGTIVSAAGL